MTLHDEVSSSGDVLVSTNNWSGFSIRKVKILGVILIAFLLVVGSGSCGGQKPRATTIQVYSGDNMAPEFFPRSVTVSVGSTVVWINNLLVKHTVVSDNGLFNHEIWPQTSYNYTFNQTGTYRYHCDEFDMAGEIIVN